MRANRARARASTCRAGETLLIVSYEELSSHNGLNTRIRGIIRALSAAGRQVEIAAPSYGRPVSQTPTILDGIRVHTIHVPDPFPRWKIPIISRVVSVALLTACMLKHFRTAQARFAWVQAEQVYPFPASYVLARKWGAGVILDDPSLLWLFVEEKLKRPRTLRWLLSKAVEAFEMALCRRADCILCSSERTAGEIGRRLDGAKARVCLMSNGVDLEEFMPGPNGTHGNRLFFNCSVPYYQNVAALRNLVRIFARFQSAAFDDYCAVVAVNDEAALPSDVARALATNPRVRLLSRPPSLVPWLQSCDLVLLPYEKGHFTTAGPRLKVFEALACGKIVLSTPEGLDQITGCANGKNVIVCADWLDMAHRTMDFIAQGETPRKRALRDEARRFVESEYSWQSLVQAYEPILGAVPAARADVRRDAVPGQ